jgi:hypothetical protein
MCDDPYGFASGEYGWSGGAVVETGTIVGKVTDYYENPIPQAFVLVIKLPPKLGGCIFTKTDDYGAYKIPDLAAPAPYLVLCFKKGFQFAWARAIVEPGGTTILDFTLSPKIVE